MPSLIDSPEIPNNDDHKKQDTAAQERLDRSADESSEQAQKTEQRYDQGHDIFTK